MKTGNHCERPLPMNRRSLLAFTMIEIVISLAVIGFALVAIIGVLPLGMDVQKQNRQETIINQDASVWLDALRNGQRGMDDLTNYVMAVTNFGASYNAAGQFVTRRTDWYTPTNSSMNPQFPLTNGFRIVGLLSTPKIIFLPSGPRGQSSGFYSNHFVAYVRSLSGPASEKPPQTNSTVQDLALSYKMITEVGPYGVDFFGPNGALGPQYWDPALTNWTNPQISTNERIARFNYSVVNSNLQANLHEMRLTFRWPLLPGGTNGPGYQMYRATVGGSIQGTNLPGFPLLEQRLYFVTPGTYVLAQPGIY